MEIPQAAADWLLSAISRVQDLTALAPGWDGYTAKSIDADQAMSAVMFLIRHAYQTVSEPAVVPLSDGGIQVEWHQGGVDLEIAFSDQEGGVFVEDHESGTTEERPLDQVSSVFFDLLGRLAA